jgi:tubulin polyglutamylase TTLL5
LIETERESSLYYRVVKSRSEVYDIISRGFSRKKRWNELPHGLDLRNSWNFLWTWSKIKIDISKLLVW